MTFNSVCVVGAGRVGRAVAARLAEQRPDPVAGRDLEPARPTSSSSASPTVRSPRSRPRRARPVDRAHERRDDPRRARAARTAVQPPPAPDVRARARPRAARRRVGGGQRRERRGARGGPRARGAPRAAAVRARGRGPPDLPRGSDVRGELPRHAPRDRGRALRRGRRAARGARAAHAPDDRERLRADRPVRPRRRETIERHLAELRERRPDLEPLYRALADATTELVR